MSDMSMDEMIEVLARYRYNAKHDADRIKALEDELSRLRASSFVTAVPAEQYERVIKAGDAMEMTLQADFNGSPYEPTIVREAIIYWRNAKKGGQP
jgi:hypothetical protein